MSFYDMMIYGHLSYYLSELFFPNENKTLSLFLGGVTGGIITFVQLLLFPDHIRQLGYGLSSSVITAIFGGTAPAICLWLTEVTGMKTAPAFYIMAAAAISLVSSCIIYFKKSLVEDELNP